MDNTRKNLEILLPKNQTQLFGYENYFNSFIELYKKNNLPNTIRSLYAISRTFSFWDTLPFRFKFAIMVFVL